MTGYSYNFTDPVRKTLNAARDEARRLRHEYVNTEHLLLGLLHDREGVALAVLANLGVDPDALPAVIDDALKPGPTAVAGLDLPYTMSAKKVLECAMIEAREFNHAYVGTEHLLLGLLAEESGIAAQSIGESGCHSRSRSWGDASAARE